jgi:hypothetical protein
MQDLRQQEMANHGDLVSINTGRVLSQVEVTGYNRYTIDFNNTLQTETKEFLLDQRHRYLVLCFNA